MSAVFEFTLLVPLLPHRHAVQLLVGTCARAPREANSDPPPLLVTEIPPGLDRGGRLGFLRGGGPAFGLQRRAPRGRRARPHWAPRPPRDAANRRVRKRRSSPPGLTPGARGPAAG